jgi:hypothetical protein
MSARRYSRNWPPVPDDLPGLPYFACWIRSTPQPAGVAELHDEIAAVRAELAEATISVSARVDAVHTKVDRLLEVVDRDGTTHLAVGASVRITGREPR